MDKIKLIEQDYTKNKMPDFAVGDTVKVLTKIAEGERARLHPFEGIVIAKKGKGMASAFTVRKISYGEGVEYVFPLYSPQIKHIDILRRATKKKRAKLYYLRKRVGRRAMRA
ncbi:MAG: 50S ribosomal protein L19 [Candidatus Omnitrophica bacterium]|nr:50S ribosomal protein L19 [Candidatus Omnitrophota bacterium]